MTTFDRCSNELPPEISGDRVKPVKSPEFCGAKGDIYRDLFERFPEAIVFVDPDGTIAEANEAACRLSACGRDQLIGACIQDILPHVNVAAGHPPQEKGEMPLRCEGSCARADGSLVPVEMAGSRIRIGGLPTLLLCLRDITHHIRATAGLRKAERNYRDMFEHAGEGIFQTSLEGRFINANPALAKIYGYDTPEELMSSLTDVGSQVYLNPDTRSSFVRQLEERGVVSRFESQARRKDGATIWTSECARVVRDEKGNPAYYEGFVQDVTERKVAVEKTLHAIEAAESAARARGEFLANISHEIRTPLNGIIGMTELALDTALTEEQREYLDRAKSSAESLLATINQVLDFSKIEAGKVVPDPVRFSLRDVVGGAMSTLASRAHPKGIEMASNILPHVPDDLVGDAYHLRQVLLNLIGNAIKFTERGEIVVQVDSALQSADSISIHFTVTDTGVGIRSDKLKSIFEPFVQADGSMTRKYGGTGLGLAIASHLVEMMGGKIWVFSEEGVGSAFHFVACFGLQKGEAPPRPAVEYPGLKNTRVLIVDDNLTNRSMLQAMLLQWEMSPSVAVDSRSALESLLAASQEAKPYSLVIVDAIMPEMDGFALVEEIRHRQAIAQIPIIMLTTSGGSIHTKTKDLRIAASLMKPIRQPSLLNAVLRALGLMPEARKPDRQETAGAAQAKGLRILLAEDNPVNQMVAVRMLERQGHEVMVASNGREALTAYDSGQFDLIIMDAQMPELNGFEAAAWIRQKEKDTGIHVPILAVTAHATDGDKERCLASGMDAYISKPLRSKELQKFVESLVGRDGLPVISQGRPPVEFKAETVLARMSGDAELLSEVVGLFLADCPRVAAKMKELLAQQDKLGLSRAAHTLRGTLDLFGFAAASSAALDVELSCDRGDLYQAGAAFTVLENELERCIPVLVALRPVNEDTHSGR